MDVMMLGNSSRIRFFRGMVCFEPGQRYIIVIMEANF